MWQPVIEVVCERDHQNGRIINYPGGRVVVIKFYSFIHYY